MLIEGELAKPVLDAFFRVYNKLGCGFLERVYANALGLELRKAGLTVEQEAMVNAMYDGVIVGHYRADMIINRTLVVEIKTELHASAEAQIMNYLRCSHIEIGLILAFGLKPMFKRVVSPNR